MAANPFDQFDAQQSGGNPFDQFDAPAQPRAFNPFSNDESSLPPLPGEQVTQTFDQGSARPGYLERVNTAVGELNKAKPSGWLGTIEAIASMATGGLAAPVLGTAESIALGTNPEESFDRYTYKPRTESGRAQRGLLGAVASPLTESGADVALAPLLAGESRALAAGPAKIPPNARRPRASPDPISAQPRPMADAAATRPQSPAPASQAQRTAGLEGVPRSSAAIDPIARYQELQSLPVPVPATRGQLTRDPVQLRNESNVAATETGKPIRDIHLSANDALLENLDVLKGRVSRRKDAAQTPEQLGVSVQDQALRKKLELKKQEVSAKYKAAEDAGELQGKVSPARLIQTVRNSPDKTHFHWVEGWLKDNDVIKKTESGTVTNKLTLKQLEDLRQAAVAKAMDGGTEGYYAGKVISAIDAATEGAGGSLYKAARAARRQQAMEFEESGAVARLVENKSRTDRATALEDTWRKTVISGSIEDLRTVKRSLLTGGDSNTRNSGKNAWRDMRAQTIQFIKDEATKSVAMNERGQPNITPASMKRAIDSIGPQKMDEIFGPGTSKQVYKILDATRTVKTVPPPIHAGSSTFGNVLSFLEKGLSKIPVLGNTASGAVQIGIKLNEAGAASKIVKEAQSMPGTNELAKPKPSNALLEY